MGEPCPECQQDKHENCTGWSLTEDNKYTTCPCGDRGHEAGLVGAT